MTRTGRIDWVDYSKGICIILVVMMHSVLGYGEMIHASGWMHGVVEWTMPFRMPDFFLIAGLFLSQSIFGSKTAYFDRKILHFAYFYLLWLAIQTVMFEADLIVSDPLQMVRIYLSALIIPKSSLWFIHMLAVFYAVVWLVRYVPKPVIFGFAALLEICFMLGYVDTGWSVTNRFAHYFVYFYTGYAAAPYIFRFAIWAKENADLSLLGFGAWATIHSLLLVSGLSDWPLISLTMGFAGALAIIVIGTWLARVSWGWPLRHAGKFSIVIYLSFFLPMKLLQKLLGQSGWIDDVGLASLIITIGATVLPLVLHWMIRHTALNFLYERPEFLKFFRKIPNIKGEPLARAAPNF